MQLQVHIFFAVATAAFTVGIFLVPLIRSTTRLTVTSRPAESQSRFFGRHRKSPTDLSRAPRWVTAGSHQSAVTHPNARSVSWGTLRGALPEYIFAAIGMVGAFLLGAAVRRSRSRPTPLWSACAVAGTPGFDPSRHLWALDFDGVLCDTEPESSQSGWRAAAKYWPGVFNGASPDDRAQVLLQMARLRPIVETGYENMLLVRLVYEELQSGKRGNRPLTVGEIMADWPTLSRILMGRWALDKQELIEFFGTVRDQWMAEDLAGWLAPNTMYPGLVDALNTSDVDMYIITTKQQRFAHALLKDAGCTKFLDPARIFGLGMGSKAEVMAGLQQKYPGRTLHFIEDRLPTLEGVIAKGPALAPWQLYLCDWGYNTPADRAAAGRIPRIQSLGLPDFRRLLQRPERWSPGVLPSFGDTGVTIGLRPT